MHAMYPAQYSAQFSAHPRRLLQQPHIESVESIAVFRALQLGDMLCSVPALRALRAAVPNAAIALIGLPWATQFAQRFSRYIDEFVVFPGHPAMAEQKVREELVPDFYSVMQCRRFSLALQLHGSGEISNGIVKNFKARMAAGYTVPGSEGDPGFIGVPYPETGPEPLRLLNLVTHLGATDMGAHLEFPLLKEDWEELAASGLCKGLKPGGYICIHPGARSRDKCWPPQYFAQVADQLARESGLTIVLTGSAQEMDLTSAVASHMRTSAVNAAAPISIGAMAAMMSMARLLICNDTGVSHIAAGLGLKSVVIFSKADMSRWAPLDQQQHRCVWDPVAEKVDEVLAYSRALLNAAAAPCRIMPAPLH